LAQGAVRKRHTIRASTEKTLSTSSTFTATDGDGYERVMGRWSRQLAPAFLDFAAIGDARRVLDVGCGTGHLATTLSQRAPSIDVTGIDASPAYIDHARRHNPTGPITFRVGDACALDAAAQTYDAVLSLLLLHFVPRADEAIAEMRRVARPGAVVAAAVWDVRGGFVANRMFFDTAAALDPRAAELRARNFTRPMTRPGELATAWRAAGLVDVTETVLQTRMAFASFSDYWAPYLGQEGPAAAYVGALADAERARLEAALRSAYLDGEPDGPRSYAASAWAVRGIAP
jgi:SAM-dependent methyltransferase